MGKVISSFTNGFPGAIARALDDVVVAFANKSEAALAFGVPVVLDATQTGVTLFDPATHTAADFVGITVRNPSKTPDTYGSSTGSYAANDLVDVLVRGHIVVKMENWDGKLGDPVTIKKADGSWSNATGADYVALPNVRISSATDGTMCAELLIPERNVL